MIQIVKNLTIIAVAAILLYVAFPAILVGSAFLFASP